MQGIIANYTLTMPALESQRYCIYSSVVILVDSCTSLEMVYFQQLKQAYFWLNVWQYMLQITSQNFTSF